MQRIHWRELNGRKTSYRLHPDMLGGQFVRTLDCRPTPYRLDKPHGSYAVEFDRLFAVEKIRELITTPLQDCSLAEILALVQAAYEMRGNHDDLSTSI